MGKEIFGIAKSTAENRNIPCTLGEKVFIFYATKDDSFPNKNWLSDFEKIDFKNEKIISFRKN